MAGRAFPRARYPGLPPARIVYRAISRIDSLFGAGQRRSRARELC
jgi:hypothetical protein